MADEKMMSMNDLTDEQLEMVSGGGAEVDDSQPRYVNILKKAKQLYTSIEEAKYNAMFLYYMFRWCYGDLTVNEILDYIEEYWDNL